jgi:hypothetical protein
MFHVTHGTGWTGQVENGVRFKVKCFRHILFYKRKMWMGAQRSNISFGTSDKIIYTQHAVPFVQQTRAKMGANKTCSPGNNYFQEPDLQA